MLQDKDMFSQVVWANLQFAKLGITCWESVTRT